MTTTTTGSLDGMNVLRACVDEPIEGVWHASLELDGDRVPAGRQTLSLDGETFVGTMLDGRVDVESGRVLARMVGGAGGMTQLLPARAYVSPVLSLVRDDILTAVGETLSVDADPLADSVPRWVRARGRASDALQELATSRGLRWRVQRDGTVFLGPDSFPEVPIAHDEIDRDPRKASVLVGPRDEGGALVAVGTTFEGLQIHHVSTSYGPGGVRQELRYHTDRRRGLWRRLVGSTVDKRLTLRALYPCTVVAQNGDGTVDLEPDDADVGAATGGLSSVRLRSGLAGFAARVPSGARCLLGFEAGDPTRPFASLWNRDDAVDELTFDGGDKAVARVDDETRPGKLILKGTELYYSPPGIPSRWTSVSQTVDPQNGPFASESGTEMAGLIATGNDKLKA